MMFQGRYGMALKSLTLAYFATQIVSGETSNSTTCAGGQSVDNAQCCKWFDVRDDLQTNIFERGSCSKHARSALRLTFHDSVGFSQSMRKAQHSCGGGADGSIIKYASVELAYRANRGLGEIVGLLKTVADNHNVSYGDIIQFAGATGVSNCPGAPRLQFLAGREDAIFPSPPDLVPAPLQNATTILDRMYDAGLTPDDTIALLASHSIATQDTVDPEIPGAPFDTTPDIFDTQFYSETLHKGIAFPGSGEKVAGEAKSQSPNEFRLASDDAFSRDPRTEQKWKLYANDQQAMMIDFRHAMIKLANIGQNIDDLIDCSEAIPMPHSPVLPALKHGHRRRSYHSLNRSPHA